MVNEEAEATSLAVALNRLPKAAVSTTHVSRARSKVPRKACFRRARTNSWQSKD